VAEDALGGLGIGPEVGPGGLGVEVAELALLAG
jgi:hypothetical protein